ncbi:hypothetical protein [Aquabacterium sp. OR-4]|uniref:hypothetical protein n=1 Tax=Aquabacterium sp. OR-4 TaxID=2978127 RepID=UPI0028C8FF8D|nr:hypothetical protein [Aquabacterium sp. OR-4]MDT7836212.1 hypothetical protein [Aquabacterium sp. OR-4]
MRSPADAAQPAAVGMPVAQAVPAAQQPGDAYAWVAAAELQITDPAAAALLWQPTQRLHLRPFLGRAAGLADAAALLGMKKPAMSYWIKRLLELGLIRPCAPLLRGRHRLPQYRCVADRLVVSLRDAPLASYEAAFEDMGAHWQAMARPALGAALARQARWLALQISLREGGLATQVVSEGPGAPADDYLFCWGRLWLAARERDALRSELDALWEKYAALSDQAKPTATLLHLLAVPEGR